MNGIFLVSDILGFKSLCRNNSEESLRSTLEWMDDLENEFYHGFLKGLFRDGSPETTRKFFKRFKWLTFADTIFVGLSFESEFEKEEIVNAMVFLTLCGQLHRRMFCLGLPLRGVIHVGPVVVTQKCFGGKAIVDALELAGNLELAACVLTSEAVDYVAKTIPPGHKLNPFIEGLLTRNEVPLKNETAKEFVALKWFSVKHSGEHPSVENAIKSDVAKFVGERFLAKNKTADANTPAKLNNTIAVLNQWLHGKPKSFRE